MLYNIYFWCVTSSKIYIHNGMESISFMYRPQVVGKYIFFTGTALKYILTQNISRTSAVFGVHNTLLNIEIL